MIVAMNKWVWVILCMRIYVVVVVVFLQAEDLLDLLGASNLGNVTLLQHSVPPGEQELVTDKLEPRSDNDAASGGEALLQKNLKLILGHPADIADLVGDGLHVDELLVLRAHEENVIDLVLAPGLVRGSHVVNAGQEVELVQGHILSLDAKLVEELALGSSADTQVILLDQLVLNVEGVRAASVGPCVGESDLLAGTLLQQELGSVGREQEDGEGTVQKTAHNVGHQVAYLVVIMSNGC